MNICGRIRKKIKPQKNSGAAYETCKGEARSAKGPVALTCAYVGSDLGWFHEDLKDMGEQSAPKICGRALTVAFRATPEKSRGGPGTSWAHDDVILRGDGHFLH